MCAMDERRRVEYPVRIIGRCGWRQPLSPIWNAGPGPTRPDLKLWAMSLDPWRGPLRPGVPDRIGRSGAAPQGARDIAQDFNPGQAVSGSALPRRDQGPT